MPHSVRRFRSEVSSVPLILHRVSYDCGSPFFRQIYKNKIRRVVRIMLERQQSKQGVIHEEVALLGRAGWWSLVTHAEERASVC